MSQKKYWTLSLSIVVSLLTFSGCGGNLFGPEGNQSEQIVWNLEGNEFFITKNSFPGKVKIENGDQSITETLSSNIKKLEFVESDIEAYQNIEDSIQQNQPVAFKLQYKSIANYLSYVTITTSDTQIGENFICFEPGKSAQGLTQILSLKPKGIIQNITESFTGGELKGFASYIKSLPDLFLLSQNKNVITDSLTSSISNPTHTVNLTLQKTTTGDYQFSNVQVSGLTLTQNNFVLKNDQYGTTDLKKLQLMLSTLFVNFNKSKEIFN